MRWMLVGAFRSLVFNATAGVREERVIRYIMNEMRKGKPYDDVYKSITSSITQHRTCAPDWLKTPPLSEA